VSHISLFGNYLYGLFLCTAFVFYPNFQLFNVNFLNLTAMPQRGHMLVEKRMFFVNTTPEGSYVIGQSVSFEKINFIFVACCMAFSYATPLGS